MLPLLQKILSTLTKGHQRSLAVKHNIVASMVLKGVSVAITLLLVPATIGYVSSEIYGVWITLASILTWFQILDLGLTPGLKNKLTEALAHSKMDYAKALVSTTYFGMLVIFVPIAVAGYLLMPYIDWCGLLNLSVEYEAEVARSMQLLCILICVQMTSNVIVSVLAAYQRVAYSQSFMVIGNFLAYLVILVLARTVPPSLPLLVLVLAGLPIFVTIVASVVLYLTCYRAISPSPACIRLDYAKGLFSLGLKFFVINAQAVIVYQSTSLLISHVSSPESVTSYNIAYKYLSVAMLLYTTITMPLWPAYTDAYAKSDFAWMQSMRLKMMKILALCALVCVAFAIVAEPFYHVWIRDMAEVPTEMTWMVTLYVISYCFMTLNGTFIVGIGKVYLETIVVVIGACLYIPAALFVARYLHQYGILLVLVILNIIYGIVFDIQTRKIISGSAKGIWNK